MKWEKFKDLFNAEVTCELKEDVVIYILYIKKLKMRYSLQFPLPQGYESFKKTLVGNENGILYSMIKYTGVENYLGEEIDFEDSIPTIEYIK